MSKVSVSACFRSINVYRYEFDAAASTDESNDSVSTLWRVTGWLCSAGMSAVSLFVFSRRYGFDSSMSTSTCNESVQMLCRTGG